ncbi:hypothetical protein [Actinomadura macrotermitis]|uniref:Uncharacterized protein n=1 Tax=Actinomadura macrotermitis TaxID=2585200 RepID=A0A7K0BZ60_9ACTN|nr:hypothetical protein [Actinomadura macrotermitis]MQY06152.1 hypothetical protein [Actinomadura macrotermitis]
MDQGFLQHVDATVHAAVTEDQAFGELMPRLMQWSQSVPVPVLNMAMTKMGEGIAAAPPNLGSFLAVIAGAWVEQGATTFGVDGPVLARTFEVAAIAAGFAAAWRGATGGAPPDPERDGPSQRIVDTVAGRVADPVEAMMAWFGMEKYALAAHTMLCRSPELRASVADRADKIRLAGSLAEHTDRWVGVAKLLNVLDGERLLVLDRKSGQGWTVTIGGIGDNFQLHMLLGGALIGRPGGMPGEPVPADIVAYFTDTDVPEPPPVTQSPWRLTDAHGGQIFNEGVPADIPAVNGTRVVVLDPPPYTHSFPAGRHHPMMTGTLTVDGLHLPEDLSGWWPHIAPARG